MTQHLFVYGTLRRGARNRFAALLARSARFIGPAKARGRLYRIKHYPGFVPRGPHTGWVLGDVFAVPQRGKLLQALDLYEGLAFERTTTKVVLSSGRTIRAWVYCYALDIKGKRRIVSGDFFL